ncbi:MAG: EutN/CcmL family microcompartment protein [Terriglobales bacterium]
MIVARVTAEVVATQKHASHQGCKVLLVTPEALAGQGLEGKVALQPAGTPAGGAALLALDAVGAGVGERVLVVMDGYAAMTAVGRPQSPIDAAIIGILDRLDLEGA